MDSSIAIEVRVPLVEHEEGGISDHCRCERTEHLFPAREVPDLPGEQPLYPYGPGRT